MYKNDLNLLESLIGKYSKNLIVNYINETLSKNEIEDKISGDAGISEDAEILTNVHHKKFNYFGNCINTVPRIWNANQMANVVYNSSIIIDNSIKNKLFNGDKHIPIRLQKQLSKYELNDFDHFIIGINEYQRIMFIYSIDDDIHYFFDAY